MRLPISNAETMLPQVDPASPLQFVINVAAGSDDAELKRQVIDRELKRAARIGELRFCRPEEMAGAAVAATARAMALRTAVVAVGGDGTLNTVAQAAHAAGCAMGVIPQGTFNYFARTHGIGADPAEAARSLLRSAPTAVQVGAVNDRVFLVNASLGLYPELLEDREAYKARFGRSRWVAFGAACATLLRAQRRLRLHIELGDSARDVRALTLFVGNNRLQLQQLGVTVEASPSQAPGTGSVTAVMLRPIGTLSMIDLMMHGAMGTLGEADGIERFEFNQMVVKPSRVHARRSIKVAYDGEVTRMRFPIRFHVLAQPLYLLKAAAPEPATEAQAGSA